MAGIGVAVAWLGYALGFYGLDQIRGGNNSFLSLVKPGKFTSAAPDAGTAPGSTGTAQTGQVPVYGAPGGTTTGPAAAITTTTKPAGATLPGPYGVDQNGNIYRKVKGKWVLYQMPGQTTPVTAI
jgi:hypothetical protein